MTHIVVWLTTWHPDGTNPAIDWSGQVAVATGHVTSDLCHWPRCPGPCASGSFCDLSCQVASSSCKPKLCLTNFSERVSWCYTYIYIHRYVWHDIIVFCFWYYCLSIDWAVFVRSTSKFQTSSFLNIAVQTAPKECFWEALVLVSPFLLGSYDSLEKTLPKQFFSPT